jgi:hypothetical protein
VPPVPAGRTCFPRRLAGEPALPPGAGLTQPFERGESILKAIAIADGYFTGLQKNVGHVSHQPAVGRAERKPGTRIREVAKDPPVMRLCAFA